MELLFILFAAYISPSLGQRLKSERYRELYQFHPFRVLFRILVSESGLPRGRRWPSQSPLFHVQPPHLVRDAACFDTLGGDMRAAEKECYGSSLSPLTSVTMTANIPMTSFSLAVAYKEAGCGALAEEAVLNGRRPRPFLKKGRHAWSPLMCKHGWPAKLCKPICCLSGRYKHPPRCRINSPRRRTLSHSREVAQTRPFGTFSSTNSNTKARGVAVGARQQGCREMLCLFGGPF